ncbi:MAG: DUF4097 domain-containing protein, partial [Acidobacteria bacterium]|nr:DUF4097 domain-containing protein [Acidobacteriota bacterium]
MKSITIIALFIKVALAVTVAVLSTTILFGQEIAEKARMAEKAAKAEHKMKHKEFCANNSWSNGDRVSFNEVREFAVPASGFVSVDAGRNGGVSIKGENRSDIAVKACVQAWGTSEEAARSLASSVRIPSSTTIRADGPSSEEGWAVSYQVLVPRNTDLKLIANNGGISISSVEGRLDFETKNGGVNLKDVAGEVRGRTTNGGVNVALTGNRWKGSGLDVQTTNGGVHLTMAETYAANIETGTTNGGFRSDIPALNVTTENVKGDDYGRRRSTNIVTAFNGGGA